MWNSFGNTGTDLLDDQADDLVSSKVHSQLDVRLKSGTAIGKATHESHVAPISRSFL
jgi:hypothetical protein